jgi:uncharacterized phiE125 gp8 family phage protein
MAKLITAPAVEPVTLVEAKDHCRYVEADQDTLFRRLIRAATTDAENITGRALIEQTLEIGLHCWPRDGIELSRPPLIDVVSVTYTDPAGATQTMPSADYTVDTYGAAAVILPAYGVTWPTVRGQVNAIRVRYRAGYGAAPGAVPEPIRAWILIRVAQIFEHREQVVAGVSVTPVPFVDGLLDPYRVLRL